MEKIRVGVIGAGIYGTNVIQAFHSRHLAGEIDLAAVADINAGALERVKKTFGLNGYSDYKEMFENERLDAVAVVTPDHLHRDAAVAAAEYGIHILAQKPLATCSGEGREMVEAAAKNNVMLYVDFHKRFDPGHIQLKQAIKAGLLGEIEYGYVCMEDPIYVPAEWFKNWARHSSPVWFIGVHFYDLIYWLLGEKPEQVYASGVKKKLASMGIDCYDSIQAKFNFPGGAGITVDASWILPKSFVSPVNQHIRIAGTDGLQEVDSQDRGVFACYEKDNAGQIINPYGKYMTDDPIIGEIAAGYTIESMLYFLRLVALLKSGKATLDSLKGRYPDGDQALVSVKMCEAAHQSAATRTVVDITY
jgi:predicted dehydrogenase